MRRYLAPFVRPTAPFEPDADTALLLHLDEGEGAVAHDASSAQGGPTHGEVKVGGPSLGPAWEADSPF